MFFLIGKTFFQHGQKKAKTRGSYQKNDPSVMEQAVKAVQSGALSLRKAAEKFNVHKSTLHDRVTKRVTLDAKPGRKPVLSNEIEKRIIKNVTESAEKGFGTSRKQLLHQLLFFVKGTKLQVSKTSHHLNTGGKV